MSLLRVGHLQLLGSLQAVVVSLKSLSLKLPGLVFTEVAVISLELESSSCDQLGVVVVSLKLLGGLARAQRVPATVRTEDGVQLCPP